MLLITFDFWTLIALGFIASVLFIGYRLTWRLAYFSEELIVNLARTGLHGSARVLLRLLIGYSERTYQQSRFIVWNQVHVRFFVLWASTFILTGLVFLFRLESAFWPVALIIISYRLVTLWMNPPRPPIHTQEPSLKQLIQDVNEPVRSSRKPASPMIRRWDYLDELFAESV
jgi:hypothetical protein